MKNRLLYVGNVATGSLHSEGVESAVNDGNGASDEGGCVADEILDSAAQLLRFAEALEWSLTDYVGAARGERPVGIGEQGAVLIGQEETGSYGIDADAK